MSRFSAGGEGDDRSYRSIDTYSSGYRRTLSRIREENWYDVRPYSLAIWPQLYSDKIRTGPWWIHRSNYDAIAVEFQLEGSSVYKSGAYPEELLPGEAYITVPGGSVRFGDGVSPGRQVLVMIAGGMVKLLMESLNLPESRRVRFDAPEEFDKALAMARQLADLMQAKRPESAPKNSSLGYELICMLADHCSRTRTDELPPSLTHAVRMMGNGFGSRFSIGKLAEELGISRVTLHKLFREYLGTTPQAYRHRLCMENAVSLVRGGQLSFKEISEQLGFRSSLYFSTVFRRYTGVSPTEYRRRETGTFPEPGRR
ncbi:MAG: helix-turn-helix transcriptional regulator [Lentisphaeria bacterium]|nr:helix-turn-helix transcriptional regulator [Lentisphaeria bacterium]